MRQSLHAQLFSRALRVAASLEQVFAFTQNPTLRKDDKSQSESVQTKERRRRLTKYVPKCGVHTLDAR